MYRFLLVSLSIETILGETTIRRRREKLRQMSSGQNVGDVYTATLERIAAQKKDRARLGMEAIMWVAYSQRPLQPDELCQALGVEIGSTDLDSDNTPSVRTILNCALGLVTVDSSSFKVRLVHFTLQEYILSNPTLFHRPHSMMAEVCLTFLNFSCIRDLSPALYSDQFTNSFLEYASCYWGAHARRKISASVISLALELLDRFEMHVACTLLLSEYKHEYYCHEGHDQTGFTGLHGAAFMGVFEIMVSLLRIKKWDLNATDMYGNTALIVATKEGHDGIVKVLLEQEGVDPNIVDVDSRTPFSWACKSHYMEAVRMLLERNDVNPDAADHRGRTPLSWASGDGFTEIVRVLLEQNNINPDAADKSSRTPLYWAAMSGHQGVMEMLLERTGINPNTADEICRTLFSWASQGGCTGVVQGLLELGDINPEAADESGRTPLSWAVESRHERIVQLLLARNDFNPDTADKSGRTPLSWGAVGLGMRTAHCVQLLLERTDVNPDAADKSGRHHYHGLPGLGPRKL